MECAYPSQHASKPPNTEGFNRYPPGQAPLSQMIDGIGAVLQMGMAVALSHSDAASVGSPNTASASTIAATRRKRACEEVILKQRSENRNT